MARLDGFQCVVVVFAVVAAAVAPSVFAVVAAAVAAAAVAVAAAAVAVVEL